MADLQQLEKALIAADKAGNADDARILAAEIARLKQIAPELPPEFLGDIPASPETVAERMGRQSTKPRPWYESAPRAAEETAQAVIGERLGLDPETEKTVFEAVGGKNELLRRLGLPQAITGAVDILAKGAEGIGAPIAGGTMGVADIAGSAAAALTGQENPELARREFKAMAEAPFLGGVANVPGMIEQAPAVVSRGGLRTARTAERAVEQVVPDLAKESVVSRAAAPIARTAERALEVTNETIDRVFPVGGRVNARLEEALKLDGMNLQSIAARAREFEARTGQRPTLLQLGGENMEGLASKVATQIGEGRSVMEDYRATVLASQVDDVQNIARRTVMGGDKDFFADLEAIQARMKKDAGPLYKKAFEQTVKPSNEIKSLLGTPAGKRALNQAELLLRNERRDPASLGIIRDGNTIKLADDVSVEALDAVKRKLDDAVEKFRDPQTQRLNLDSDGRAIDKLRYALKTEVGKQSKDYRDALEVFSGDASLIDAMTDARDVMKKPSVRPEVIMRRMKNMTDAEKEMYRSGAIRGIVDVLEDSVTDVDRIRKIVRSDTLKNKLRVIFGDDKNADEFIRQLEDAAGLTKRLQSVSGKVGSQTALRGENISGFGDIMQRRSLLEAAAERAYGALRQQRNQRNEQIINRDIAKIMTQPLTDDLLDVLSKRLANEQ